MTRQTSVALLALAVLAPMMAQAPKGWKVRSDRSTSASDPDAAGDIKFVTSGSGFHATNPQAAVYWNPANTASGNYTLKGTFTLMKPSGHNNYYGLIFGGSGRDKVDFVVNGTVVHSEPKSAVKTDGIYGIRVNHLLEVQIDGLAVSK
jgi:hypothetical protein